jgi:hypothetical protein
MKLDIKNGEIRQIIVGDLILPLKKRIKLTEAEKIEGVVKFLEEHVDFSNVATDEPSEDIKDGGFEWTDEELRSFLKQTRSGKQTIFLKNLSKNPDHLYWNDLKDIMESEGEELVPFTMAGILSCFARRAKHFGKKEDFWESVWDDDKEERYYTLKPKYRKFFSEYFR